MLLLRLWAGGGPAILVCIPMLLTIASVQYTDAWSAEGHQAIGMVTMSSIGSHTATQMKRIMGGKDVVDIVGWAHRVEEKFPETKALHFLHQPIHKQCDTLTLSDDNCKDNYCLVRSLQHFYGRLSGQPSLMKLDYPHGLPLTDSDALKFLVNLIGDLHQPLRLGFQDDAGGKNISFFYTDLSGKRKETTLFDFWDSELIHTVATENPAYWFGGWTHANALGPRLLAVKEEWEKQPADKKHLLFEKWALESLQKACAFIYSDQKSQPVVSGYEAKTNYEYTAFELIKTQLLIAGARTALVLDAVLKDRDVVKLRQGSAIEILLGEEDPKRSGLSTSSQRYFRSFCINVGIILVVLSVLAYVTRFYSPAAIASATSTVGGGSSISSRFSQSSASKYGDKKS